MAIRGRLFQPRHVKNSRAQSRHPREGGDPRIVGLVHEGRAKRVTSDPTCGILLVTNTKGGPPDQNRASAPASCK